MTNYAALLKESGLKATFQRMNILEVIEKYGHMSVEDIYEEVIKVHPSLSLATIYKNIILMMEKGVLVEVPIAGKKSKYEISKVDHMHLICTECGEVEDRPCLDSTDKILHELIEQEHFKLKKRQINLYGVCEKCQMQEAS
jgi:Fur family ferric uptake transcriptional regulator/Fur family peroxide stress response transcriptional regulator